MKQAILFISLLLISIGGKAQERWSLRRCIDYAIEHNINIRRTANAVEQSAVEANSAKWARLPNLNGSAGQSWNWGRTQTAVKNEDTGDYSTVYVNTSSQGSNLNLSTSIPLFTGLQIPNQYALAKLNLKAATADLAKAQEDIAINVASAYLQVLFNQELQQVATIFRKRQSGEGIRWEWIISSITMLLCAKDGFWQIIRRFRSG